jgi:hypothetical protein
MKLTGSVPNSQVLSNNPYPEPNPRIIYIFKKHPSTLWAGKHLCVLIYRFDANATLEALALRGSFHKGIILFNFVKNKIENVEMR